QKSLVSALTANSKTLTDMFEANREAYTSATREMFTEYFQKYQELFAIPELGDSPQEAWSQMPETYKKYTELQASFVNDVMKLATDSADRFSVDNQKESFEVLTSTVKASYEEFEKYANENVRIIQENFVPKVSAN
ncbi:MAG: hypothetical protein AAGI38_15245, partial [Bacteroidota bacterium]